ncbi:MAG: UDP-N-acetylmuramoyl-L-alanine--D-glutamate ligase, partial [Clostridia bacterium]|nr:UDP-N-acetylmuramoyl-L-alanine--D-glutamate ligase [Clostridia bacterium]
AKALAKKGAFAVLYGQTAYKIAQALEEEGVPFIQVATLAEAIDYTFAHTKRDGVVLFSPACASFDAYSDYKARSRAFYEMIFKER